MIVTKNQVKLDVKNHITQPERLQSGTIEVRKLKHCVPWRETGEEREKGYEILKENAKLCSSGRY